MQQLENIKTWHCFFEQSGTFKNQFKRLGFNAYDYDILDDFGETDYKKDLFAEIAAAYEGGGASIFDKIEEGEAIMAFFPCVRFEVQILMKFRGESWEQQKYTDEQKLIVAMKLHEELAKFYELITKFVIVCIRRNIPLIIENPYSTQHYLTRYWPLKPKILDMNRRQNGDYYEKHTQFWFVNCEPLNNLLFDEPIAVYPKKIIENQRTVERSLISPGYARRFIRSYLKVYNADDCNK